MYKNPTKTPEIQGDLCPIFQGKHLYKNLQESKKPKKREKEQNFKDTKDTVNYISVT